MPKIKPRNDPNADLKEVSAFLLLKNISAAIAPKKAPIIIPNGGKKNNPTIVPTSDPLAASLQPPVTFVKYAGTK